MKNKQIRISKKFILSIIKIVGEPSKLGDPMSKVLDIDYAKNPLIKRTQILGAMQKYRYAYDTNGCGWWTRAECVAKIMLDKQEMGSK